MKARLLHVNVPLEYGTKGHFIVSGTHLTDTLHKEVQHHTDNRFNTCL